MSKFTILFLFLLINTSAIASTDSLISRRPLSAPEDPNLFAQNDDKIALLEREVQALLGRVEILEHAVSGLRSGQASLQQVAPATQVTPSDILSESPKEEIAQPFKSPTPDISISNKNSAGSEKRSYDAALLALKENQYEDAEARFSDFIQRYPKSVMIPNAYFWHGETFFRRGNFEKAAISYLKGYKLFPKASKASDSLLKLALSLGGMKKNKEACSMLHKLDLEFKDRPANSIKRASDAKNKYGCKS
jgi:tol-pal system protein YbgF